VAEGVDGSGAKRILITITEHRRVALSESSPVTHKPARATNGELHVQPCRDERKISLVRSVGQSIEEAAAFELIYRRP